MSSRLGDGLWETKFILPEHREAIKVHLMEDRRKDRPMLDDQELEQIQQRLAESYGQHQQITVLIWDEYEDREVTGIIIAVQTYLGEVKVSIEENDWEWVRIKDIIQASIN
ncbi:YolD-like protein [compost metagenome]